MATSFLPGRVSTKRLLVALFIIAVTAASLLTLFHLGQYPLADFDEATYGQIAQNTLAHGDWMTFQLSGNNWFEKPPLYLWLVMFSIRTFGVSEFAVRLPSALFNVAVVALLYLLVWELSEDVWLSFFCSIAILAVQPFYIYARQSRMDVPVIAAILFAVFCFVKGNKRGKEKYLLGFGIGLGLGIMIKSVIGLLAIVPAIVWSVLYKKWDWFKNKYFWIGALLAAIIVLPWHFYELWRFGSAFWQNYFVQQVFHRGMQGLGGQAMTAGDYFGSLWYLVQPWTAIFLLLIPATIFFRTRCRKRTIAWFGFFSTILIFSFFLISKTKIWTYLLPIFPFAIIFIGAGLFYSLSAVLRLRSFLLFLICAGILSVAFYNTMNDAFINLPGYVAYLQDEKAVGATLAPLDLNKDVFFCCWPAVNTIMFYSGRSLVDVTARGAVPNVSNYFIIPTSYLPELRGASTLYESAQLLYSGPYLSLLDIK